MAEIELGPTDPQSAGALAIKRFDDGRVARIVPQIYNVQINVSESITSPGWDNAW